jgi:PhnB protein
MAVETTIREVLPYIIVRNAPAAIAFYKKVFCCEEQMRLSEPGGRVGHAQLKLGSTTIMLADEHPEFGILSPLAFGGSGSILHLNVSNVDELTDRARDSGAKILMEPKDQFYGERSSKFVDPFGHLWMLGQHIEDVSPDEMQKRYDALLAGN